MTLPPSRAARHLSVSLLFLCLALPPLLVPAREARGAEKEIPIIVDGIPLDAKGLVMKNEVYIPAWILENYARTKVRWGRGSNILEIMTGPDAKEALPPTEGLLKIRIGFYLDSEGFVVGGTTRLFLLGVDPKDFRFPDGKSPAERAHEGAVDRIGKVSAQIHEYLALSPTERFSPKGWRIVARIPSVEIENLAATVDRYELLYLGLYYDIITNLVISKEQDLKSPVIDEGLRGTRVENIPVREDGTAEIRLPNGIYFLYARMLYKNRQIVWDLPVSIRGGEATIELSNRNAALAQ